MSDYLDPVEADRYMELIAWLINCDNEYWKFKPGKRYTIQDIKFSNSHGETYGIASAISFIRSMYHEGGFKQGYLKDVSVRFIEIGDFNTPVSGEWMTTLGLRCITMLWQAPAIQQLITRLDKKVL